MARHSHRSRRLQSAQRIFATERGAAFRRHVIVRKLFLDNGIFLCAPFLKYEMQTAARQRSQIKLSALLSYTTNGARGGWIDLIELVVDVVTERGDTKRYPERNFSEEAVNLDDARTNIT